MLLKTKLILILPPVLRVWGSSLKFAFPLLMSSKNSLPHSTIACNVSYCRKTTGVRSSFLQGKFQEALRVPKAFSLGCPGLKDLDGRPNKLFREHFGLPNILTGVSVPPSWSPKLINQ